jgi:hypothetical protein
MADTKTAIVTPSRDLVHAAYTYDLVELIRHDPTVRYGMSLGSMVGNQRHAMVHGALSHGATHVLMIDSDMRFPPDTLDRLLAHGVDIVGANYVPRGGQGTTARYADGSYVPSQERTGLEAVHVVGCGVVLISAAVFRALDPPWFPTPWDEESAQHVSEDVWFCARASKAGYQAHVDHDLSREVKHVGWVELGIGMRMT